MDSCNANLPGGKVDCVTALKGWRGIAIMDKGTQFSSKTDALNKAKWVTKLSTDLSVFVPTGFNSIEVTTDDVNVTTSQFGEKMITRQGVPSFVAKMKSNFCDAKEMEKQFQGGIFDVTGLLEGGNLFMDNPDVNKYGGLPARVWAIADKIANVDEPENVFTLYVNFIDLADFATAVVLAPVGWNPLKYLSDAMPLGLNIVENTAYTGGDIVVNIFDRCGDLHTGLVTTDFQALRSNDLTSLTIVASAVGGIYTLTIQKGAVPGNLAAGDWVEIRVKLIVATVVTYISGRFIVNA